MAKKSFFQQIGMGVASLIFGVALSIFIYAAASGLIVSLQTVLLYATTFLMMLRFWYRYSELFVQSLPSKNFWHFAFDFGAAFFGILAVLFIGDIMAWALLGAATMIASAIRCGLSWREAAGDIKKRLGRTLWGSVLMLIIALAVYGLAFAGIVEQLTLSASVFVIILLFVIYASRKP